jgi:glycosyltransferase involved in cell wall biosynthesis
MTGRGALTVGFVGGSRPAGNVRTFLANVRRLLERTETRFECVLLASADTPPLDGYEHADVGFGDANSARERISETRRAVATFARRHEPDVLFQVTRFPTHGVGTAIAGRQTGTPTVTRLAGENFSEYALASAWSTRSRLFALKNVLALAAVHLPTRVVVLGPNGRDAIRARFRRNGVDEVPQPVDTERFHPVERDERDAIRRALGWDDERVLLSVGRITRRKGANAIAATANELADRDADVRWVLVGNGPEREALDSIPPVDAVGRVPHDRIPDYYRAADLLVHPSLHEGLPNVLLEATACGLPSVARDVGECATVAAATFESDERLPELVLADYDDPTLRARFDDDALADRYEATLRRAAGE